MIPAPHVESQQQAQETLYGYMRRTLEGLPDGVSIFSAHPWQGGKTSACDDRIDQENAPITYHDTFDMKVPIGTDHDALIGKIRDLWRSWGWRVEERESDSSPSWYGRSPDGYELNVMGYAGRLAGYPPTFGGRSPCFSPKLRDDHVPKPRVITRDGLQYDEPAESPEVSEPPHKVFDW
ncbi:hypothetical protein [Segniliparus rugosus]|uniref:Uncharacterized protein n=1 Tax=Segniliparus rugosus (strain ATCC BAA-974 / DSM 45345 / CCUG 50838 / CIP 108380 / JCM 13579 / CDC 945) TaxID=679197 RepID=E5XTC4_SEGRC|nr:hypothetical protein [Segniliparus rugosus]EFV12386.1 hypothetical protein HMPREF9336_02746 [Segniliparus rugosus ATCC BAA-974]